MTSPHPVSELLREAAQTTEFQQIVRALARGEKDSGSPPSALGASGLTFTARTLYAALLREAVEKPLLYIVRSNSEAEQALDLLETWARFLGQPGPTLIPAHDIRPYQGLSPHADITEKRALGLGKLGSGQASIVVMPVTAAIGLIEPPQFYRGLARQIRKGDEVDLDELIEHLTSVGYDRSDLVEMTGQFSQRGGILDVFSPESPRPVRLELFGDVVESIREYDPATQRSTGAISSAKLLPFTESPIGQDLLAELMALAPSKHSDLYNPGEPFPGWEFLVPLLRPLTSTVLDILNDAIVFLDEPQVLKQEVERLWMLLEPEFEEARKQGNPAAPPEQLFLRWEQFSRRIASRHSLSACEFDMGPAGGVREHLHLSTRTSPRYHGNLQLSLADIKTHLTDQYRILVMTGGQGETERLAELFAENEIPFHVAEKRPDIPADQITSQSTSVPACWIAKGNVPDGVTIPASRLLILGNEDLFEASPTASSRPMAQKSKISTFLSDFRDLEPGDFVVHVEHGIAAFRGLKEIPHEGLVSEFMELEFADNARLYVPLSRLDLVQKYRMLEAGRPPLDKLGGASWAKTKSRVKKSMQDMAEELLKLYAERKTASAVAFATDNQWQREFDEAFEFDETPDQLATIEDVTRDMAKTEPMDRLVCGDVGYGKTEVAMRAAFRAASQGKQVAVLAPTTVLAFQHFQSFTRRFAAFPLRIDMLSRFRTAAQQKVTLADLEAGKVDVVIGTHRLLSKDVVFPDLGLLIVDEEQRFGVRHKERLKAMKKSVHVLSLSATPIPRTLHMSLVGLRDMSVIETPPRDRLAIQTVVAPFGDPIIKTAIEQELERGGQVYFIHNRVESLFSIAALVQRLIPQAKIAAAHGQMGERELERVMMKFVRHEADVLVTTTIVENGLDIPLANTIIVNRADRHGLSELYQLRGRVGRSSRRAYAYLLVPENTELTPLARRRLSALREFTELGSGFRIAALDMELRGAGNLLGGQQHGHIEAIGFEMYCKMLEQAVQQIKGQEAEPEIAAAINLGLDIRIPSSYIPEEHQRLRMYKRLGELRGEDDRTRAEKELIDRYGPPPESVISLLDYALIKSTAQRLWIQAIDRKGDTLQIRFHPGAPIEPERLMKFITTTPGARFTPSGVLSVRIQGNTQEILRQVENALKKLYE